MFRNKSFWIITEGVLLYWRYLRSWSFIGKSQSFWLTLQRIIRLHYKMLLLKYFLALNAFLCFALYVSMSFSLVPYFPLPSFLYSQLWVIDFVQIISKYSFYIRMNISSQDQILSPLSCTPDHKLPGTGINFCFWFLGKTHHIAHI